MKLPAFYPDAPEIRKDISQYYDDVTAADYIVGDVLAWMEKYKLADNTVIMAPPAWPRSAIDAAHVTG